ncbi:hypothetical protein HDU67_003904, partial [Dinochytrium kinnereticum]
MEEIVTDSNEGLEPPGVLPKATEMDPQIPLTPIVLSRPPRVERTPLMIDVSYPLAAVDTPVPNTKRTGRVPRGKVPVYLQGTPDPTGSKNEISLSEGLEPSETATSPLSLCQFSDYIKDDAVALSLYDPYAVHGNSSPERPQWVELDPSPVESDSSSGLCPSAIPDPGSEKAEFMENQTDVFDPQIDNLIVNIGLKTEVSTTRHPSTPTRLINYIEPTSIHPDRGSLGRPAPFHPLVLDSEPRTPFYLDTSNLSSEFSIPNLSTVTSQAHPLFPDTLADLNELYVQAKEETESNSEPSEHPPDEESIPDALNSSDTDTPYSVAPLLGLAVPYTALPLPPAPLAMSTSTLTSRVDESLRKKIAKKCEAIVFRGDSKDPYEALNILATYRKYLESGLPPTTPSAGSRHAFVDMNEGYRYTRTFETMLIGSAAKFTSILEAAETWDEFCMAFRSCFAHQLDDAKICAAVESFKWSFTDAQSPTDAWARINYMNSVLSASSRVGAQALRQKFVVNCDDLNWSTIAKRERYDVSGVDKAYDDLSVPFTTVLS